MLKAEIRKAGTGGGAGSNANLRFQDLNGQAAVKRLPSPALPSIRNGGEGESVGDGDPGRHDPQKRDRLPWATFGRPAGASIGLREQTGSVRYVHIWAARQRPPYRGARGKAKL